MWEAVVLLDEADVFLEARDDSSHNAERNALVAILLKHLEYFAGICFLTTNRLLSLDQAIKSRIHLALGYDQPSFEVRRRIWTKFLQKVPTDELGTEDIDDCVENIVSYNINGREISNAINTARTLARFEEQKLRLDHLEIVLHVRSDFNKSLEKQSKKMERVLSDGGPVSHGLVKRGSIVENSDG